MSRIKQVKETLVEAFNDNNVSSTVLYNDKCVVCYVTNAEDAMLAIKDLTERVYFTTNPNIFACLMDGVNVAIVVGVAADDIEPIYKMVKGALRTSYLPVTPPVDVALKQDGVTVQAKCIRDLEKLLEGSIYYNSLYAMKDYIACLTGNLDETCRIISGVASQLVKTTNECVVVGFVGDSVVAIYDCNENPIHFNRSLFGDLVADVIANRDKYEQYVPANNVNAHGQDNHVEKPDNGNAKEKPMPKGQYNLFCNAHQEAPASSLNIFNHAVNVITGDRLFKAIFRLIESYMRHFNMVSIPSLYNQGRVTDPTKIPKLYSMTPTGTLQWDRHAIIMLPSCQEVEWHSSQYISEVPRKHNETFLLNIIDNDGRHFKVAIHGTVASYHGKPLYLMNIFELLQDNQEPYAGDVYEHLMDYLNN